MKRVISLSTTLSIIICSFCLAVFSVSAAPSETIIVNDEIIFISDAETTIQCGEGTAVYTASNNTLTLNNATISKSTTGIQSSCDLNIVVNGVNEIGKNNNENFISGIYVDCLNVKDKPDINISGDGTLNITTQANTMNLSTSGIFCYGDVTITDTTVNLTDKSTVSKDESIGIRMYYPKIQLKTKNAKINITNYAYGIWSYAYLQDEIATGLELVDTTLKISGENVICGITNVGEIKFTNSTIDITVPSHSSDSIATFAFEFYQNCVIDNSKVNIDFNGKSSISNIFGNTIIGSKMLEIKNKSEVTINNKNVDAKEAIVSQNIVIDDSTVNITNNSGYYAAITATQTLTIKNGANVTAESTGITANTIIANQQMIIEKSTVKSTSFGNNAIYVQNGNLIIKDGDTSVTAKSTNGIAIAVCYDDIAATQGDVGIMLQLNLPKEMFDTEGNKISEEKLGTVTTSYFIDEEEKDDATFNASKDLTIKITVVKADYSSVDTALAKIPTDLSNYSEASVKALTDAKAKIVKDLDITKQSQVDAFATAIKTAIAGLTLKPADYSSVDTALAKIPTDLSGYTADSVKALTDAKAKIVKDLDITKQSQVDAFATAIEAALANLKKAETKPVTSPNTGDSSATPIVVLLAAVSSLSVLVLAKKRKTN